MKYKFLILVSDPMSKYTLSDLELNSNVNIVSKINPFKCFIINIIFKIHLSVKINNLVNLPLKSIWYHLLFNKHIVKNNPKYIIFTSPWYSSNLYKYFKKKCRDSKLLLQCKDTVKLALTNNKQVTLQKMKEMFDGIIVYNELDAIKYGFNYHPVGYSKIDEKMIPIFDRCNVCFIGTAKNRINDIKIAYRNFNKAGLKCYFYVVGAKKEDQDNDGIIYSDKNLSFTDYLGHELASDCLFELLQDGSTGRTYRLMEAIIYNKKLITNCPEVLNLKFYDKDCIQYFDSIEKIDPDFIKNDIHVNYKYDGEFSPIHLLEEIEENWK